MRGIVLTAFIVLLTGITSAQTVGSGWWVQNPPFPTSAVHDVRCVSTTSAYIVTESGHVAHTRDHGRSWDTLAVHSTQPLNGLAVKGDICIAVGDNGTILRTVDGGAHWMRLSAGTSVHLRAVAHVEGRAWVAIGDQGVIVRSGDDGGEWITPPSGTAQTLHGISFFSATHGLIAGAGGMSLSTTDGGQSWSPRTISDGQVLRGVSMIGAADAWACGYRGLLKTTDAGTTWQSAGRSEILTNIAFTDNMNGTAVGINGVILRTRNGGFTWEVIASGTIQSLWSISFAADRQNGIITGSANTVLVTTNGGTTWITRSRGTGNLWGVAFRGVLDGVAVGEGGAVLTTKDGGRRWTAQDAGTGVNLRAVAWVGTRSVVAVGDSGRVLRSTDGGATWRMQTSDVSTLLLGVSFADSLQGFAVGERGVILHTRDAGATWMPQRSGTTRFLYAIDHIDAQTAIAVGEYGIVVRTRDGGSTWHDVPSGTQEQLRSLCFTSTTTGTIVGNNGLILRTTDAGATWRTQTRDSLQVSLFGVSFADDRFGVAVGYYWPGLGSMIFTTSDGGATWNTEAQGIKDHLWAVAAPAPGIVTAAGSNTIILRRDMLYAAEPSMASVLPTGFILEQNFPNPFNPSTTIPFAVAQPSHVTLTVHDAVGRVVATIVDRFVDAGRHLVHFDASDLPSGTYICVMTTQTARLARPMLVMK